MYGDTERGGAATALRFVTCDLSSLTDCSCMTSADSDLVGSSNKRKTRSSGSLIDPDSFTALSAKRLILVPPTLIDRLISRNKSALEEMEGRRRGPGRPPLSVKNKVDPKEPMKRKRTESMNGASPAVKRLRSAKEGSESDSSESRNTSIDRKRGRPPVEKAVDKKPSPKKPTRKIERRCSVRIHHSSLRSGKKRKELRALKQKRIKNLSKDPKGKKKWNGLDKTDSNSNVCPENDSNDEIDDSTDSEMSRGPSDISNITLETKITEEKQKSPEEDVKKKRKRRKRDSMWVRKVKKQIKVKTENPETSHSSLPSLDKVKPNEDGEEEEDVSDILEASDIPILDKESDESLVLDNSNKIEPVLSSTSAEDVAMPKLEKEVDLPSENNEDLIAIKQVTEVVESESTISPAVVPKSEILSEVVPENNTAFEIPIEEKKADEFSTTSIATEEKDADVASPAQNEVEEKDAAEVPLDISQEENSVYEDACLNEKDTNNLPPEEKNTEYTNIETENVENETKELKIFYERNEDTSVLLIKQAFDESDSTHVENSIEDQLVDTKENILSISQCNMAVTNVELNASEETNNFKTIENEEMSKLINEKKAGICKEGEISDTGNKEVEELRETDMSETFENIMEFNHENTDSKMINSDMEIKEEPMFDADSTSDVKPSLDDSFTEFSLSLPDDLDLDSSVSEEHEDRSFHDREESDHIFPDSTEETKPLESKNEDTPPFRPIAEPSPDAQSFIPNEASDPCDVAEERKKSGELDMAVITNNEEKNSLNNSQEKLDSKTAEDVLSEIMGKDKTTDMKYEELTTEQRQMKESVLQALGLKSSTATPQQPTEKPKRDGYTGTLKAVIKLNRIGDKKRMVYRRSEDSLGELEYRICSEIPATDGVPITHLNDIASIRKNVSNKLHHDNDVSNNTSCGSVTSNGHSEDNEFCNQDEPKGPSSGKESSLIIPEKSSSFSIHPGKLCSDVCSYCFGKFGCLDTPCHIAQLKSERQKKILENETHLTGESCLCDACYRYVDRKANCPSKANAGTSGGKTKVRPPASSQCCVTNCTSQATQTVKKKWLVKLKKTISNKVLNDKLDIDLDKSAAMYFPLCAEHHYWVDYFTVCGICRKRLNRNHLITFSTDTDRLNLLLAEDGIPTRLNDKLFLCKLCRYYSNIRLKYADPQDIPANGRLFYRDYRRKILSSMDVPVSDSDEEQLKEDKNKGVQNTSTEEGSNTNGAGTSDKSEEGVMSLTNLATLLGDQPEQQARIQVKFGNVNIGRLSNLNIGQGGREERPHYSDVGLQANLEFQGPAVPDGSWERCVSTIQFDKRTKNLWQDLQKPYGNQSSFLRHLVMLEKYWRAGNLCLAQGADERAAKYLNGVKNRIKAFEGSSDKPSAAATPTPTPPPVPATGKFPLITNTGEIEVTPLKVSPQKKTTPPVTVEKKQMTPLDRAKSLVRMIQPSQRFSSPIQRYQVPMYVPYSYSQAQQHQNHHPQQRVPPLLKLRKPVPQAYYPTMPPIPGAQILKPILPKLPRALTVTQVSHGVPAITLNRSGITIEKQSGGSSVMPALPIEKPSISVFREPAPGPP